jgi:hypothetical protein
MTLVRVRSGAPVLVMVLTVRSNPLLATVDVSRSSTALTRSSQGAFRRVIARLLWRTRRYQIVKQRKQQNHGYGVVRNSPTGEFMLLSDLRRQRALIGHGPVKAVRERHTEPRVVTSTPRLYGTTRWQKLMGTANTPLHSGLLAHHLLVM